MLVTRRALLVVRQAVCLRGAQGVASWLGMLDSLRSENFARDVCDIVIFWRLLVPIPAFFRAKSLVWGLLVGRSYVSHIHVYIRLHPRRPFHLGRVTFFLLISNSRGRDLSLLRTLAMLENLTVDLHL